MSDDFISGLQDDLREAFERYEQRGPRRRAVGVLRPLALRPAVLLPAAAIAALIALAVFAVRALQPAPTPVRPHVVAELTIGGTPRDATLAGGTLWVTDFDGALLRVDPEAHRVSARFRVPSGFGRLAVDGGSIWLRGAGSDECVGGPQQLVRVDQGTGRIAVRKTVDAGTGLAAGGGAVWVPRCFEPPFGIDRLARDGTLTARISQFTAEGVALGDRALWAIATDGTVVQADPTTARITQRHAKLAPLSNPNTTNTKALVSDGTDGAWVISSGRAALFHISRAGAVRRIPIDPAAQPLLAKAGDALWFETADRLGAHHRLVRIDSRTGRVTATLELGAQRPIALVADGDQLCVLTGNGRLLFVRS
jgi:streptogramin lyase